VDNSEITILSEKIEHVAEKIKHVTDKVDKISEVIIGDPIDPNRPGYSIRLDRLEQKQKTLGKLLWGIASIFFTIICSMIIGYYIS
jgi:hypothetical protein